EWRHRRPDRGRRALSVATEFGSRRQGRGNVLDRRVNLYDVLQVSVNAGPEVIRAAYRALAREYHPDVNPSPEAARHMRQLNAAYHVLSDPARRARYDTVRGRWAQTRTASARGPANPRTVRRRSSSMTGSSVAIGHALPMRRTSGPHPGRVL